MKKKKNMLNVVIEPKCYNERIEITKNNIKEFYILLDERRDICWGRVKSMVRGFESNVHFESPIVINENNVGKRVIIDGNHRIEAMKMFIEWNPEAKFKVDVSKYKNYTRQEEREIYTLWNKGKQESATDYLKNYYKTIPYGSQILRQLPVSLEKSEKLPIRLVVGAHINSKKSKRFEGGYGFGGERTVKDFSEIVPQDIRIIKSFIDEFSEIFGEPKRKKPYYRSTPYTAFYRVWYDNKEHLTPPKMKRAFKKILNEWDERWDMNSKKGGRSACIGFYQDLITTLRHQNTSLNFRSDLDKIRITEENEAQIFEGKKPMIPV